VETERLSVGRRRVTGCKDSQDVNVAHGATHDEVLKRMLKMPPQPHGKPVVSKKLKKVRRLRISERNLSERKKSAKRAD
jgi:hypothetical protein